MVYLLLLLGYSQRKTRRFHKRISNESTTLHSFHEEVNGPKRNQYPSSTTHLLCKNQAHLNRYVTAMNFQLDFRIMVSFLYKYIKMANQLETA